MAAAILLYLVGSAIPSLRCAARYVSELSDDISAVIYKRFNFIYICEQDTCGFKCLSSRAFFSSVLTSILPSLPDSSLSRDCSSVRSARSFSSSPILYHRFSSAPCSSFCPLSAACRTCLLTFASAAVPAVGAGPYGAKPHVLQDQRISSRPKVPLKVCKAV